MIIPKSDRPIWVDSESFASQVEMLKHKVMNFGQSFEKTSKSLIHGVHGVAEFELSSVVAGSHLDCVFGSSGIMSI